MVIKKVNRLIKTNLKIQNIACIEKKQKKQTHLSY